MLTGNVCSSEYIHTPQQISTTIQYQHCGPVVRCGKTKARQCKTYRESGQTDGAGFFDKFTFTHCVKKERKIWLTHKQIWYKFKHLYTLTFGDILLAPIWTEVGFCGRPNGKSDTLKGKKKQNFNLSRPPFSSVLKTVWTATFLNGIEWNRNWIEQPPLTEMVTTVQRSYILIVLIVLMHAKAIYFLHINF